MRITEKKLRSMIKTIIEGESPSDKFDAHWDEWWKEVNKHMSTTPEWNAKTEEKGAFRCYNDGYTTDEFEEEWLARKGLL